MSRNASGTYSLPAGNPVITGTTIASSWANTTLNDLAAEMTDSLDRSGKGGMLAALKLVDGTVGVPALAFSSEATSGIYRAGSNDFRLAAAGIDRLTINASGISAKLADGTVGAPSLSFNSDAASGLYRAGSNDFRLAVAGADKLRLTDASVAPALVHTSPQAAAGTQDDFQFNTTNTRTAGNLLGIYNGGALRLLFDYNGAIHLNAPASGGGSYLVTDQTNSGLVLRGNKSALDTGVDVVVLSNAIRTAGLLLDVQNNGTSKFKVDYAGSITAAGNLTTNAATIDSSGAITALGSTLAQLVLNDSSIVGAEKRALTIQADFNNTEIAYWSPVTWKHRFYSDVHAETAVRASPNANSQLTLQGNRAAADTGPDVVILSSTTRNAGKLLAVNNYGTEKFGVGYDGTIYQNGSVFAAPWTPKFQTSDVTCPASTTTDLTGLSFAMASGVTYHIRGYVAMVDSADATTVAGLQAKSTGAPTQTLYRATENSNTSGSNTMTQAQNTAGFGNQIVAHNNNTAGNYAPRWVDFIITTSSTGTFQLQLVVGAGNSYVVSKGSYIEYAIVQ